jgi:hypothetical protein
VRVAASPHQPRGSSAGDTPQIPGLRAKVKPVSHPALGAEGGGVPLRMLRALPMSDASACRALGSLGLPSGPYRFRFLALGLVLACPRLPPRRSRCSAYIAVKWTSNWLSCFDPCFQASGPAWGPAANGPCCCRSRLGPKLPVLSIYPGSFSRIGLRACARPEPPAHVPVDSRSSDWGKKKKKTHLIACRGLGRAVGPLLAARALPLRCAASAMLSSTLLAI